MFLSIQTTILSQMFDGFQRLETQGTWTNLTTEAEVIAWAKATTENNDTVEWRLSGKQRTKCLGTWKLPSNLKNHPIEKEKNLPSTSFLGFKMLIFQSVNSFYLKLFFPNDGKTAGYRCVFENFQCFFHQPLLCLDHFNIPPFPKQKSVQKVRNMSSSVAFEPKKCAKTPLLHTFCQSRSTFKTDVIVTEIQHFSLPRLWNPTRDL